MRLWFLATVILCIVSLSIFAWFKTELRAARQRLVSASATLATQAGMLEYATAGHGPDVLVIHGSAGGYDQGLEMVGPLAEKGVHLIAPSRAGYLRSSLPNAFTVAEQADLYAALLDHLEIRRIAIVAISAGAWSALEFASRHPDRCQALVLLVPASPLQPGEKNHGGWIARLLLHSDFAVWAATKLTAVFPDALSRSLLGVDGSVLRAASASERKRIRRIETGLLPLSTRQPGIEFDIAVASTPPDLNLARISCPVLAISTEDDAFGTAVRAAEIVSHTDNGSLIVYPTGGHALVGRLADVIRATEAFISSTRASDPTKSIQ